MIDHPKPDPNIRAADLELSTLRNIESLLGHAINLLHDAERFARHIDRSLIASGIEKKAKALRGRIMPVVTAEITRLENKLRP